MVGVVVVLNAVFIGSLLMLVAWAKGHLRHGLKGYPHEGVAMMAFRSAKPGSLWDRGSQRSRAPSTNNP
jgi:hypothetical protein